MTDDDYFICELCGQDVEVGTDDDYCYDCVDAAEEITGKELAERRVFYNGDGKFSAWWEDIHGNVLDEDDVLIDWPSREAIMKHRGIA